jgi:hypothetical protein
LSTSSQSAPTSTDSRVRILTEDEFDWRRGIHGYDSCLHVLDDSPDHLPALESMLKVPGVALAHGVRLLPLYAEMWRRRFLYEPYWLENKLIELYGDRLPRDYLQQVAYEHPEANRTLSMTREIQSHAEQVLVHSRRQAEIMQLERPADAAPTYIVPRAIPRVPTSALGHLTEKPIVLPIGSSAPKLREALGHLGGDLPGSVAVQMDDSDIGAEGWDAVCDCIAARVPIIVGGAGWEDELPPPVVLPVADDCSSIELAERVVTAASDASLRERVRDAQDRYAADHSFSRVAERYAELLGL